MSFGVQSTPIELPHPKEKVTLPHYTWAVLDPTLSLVVCSLPGLPRGLGAAPRAPPPPHRGSPGPWEDGGGWWSSSFLASPPRKYLVWYCNSPVTLGGSQPPRNWPGEHNSEGINKDLTYYHFRKVADRWLGASLGESAVKKRFWADVFSAGGFLRPLAGSALN